MGEAPSFGALSGLRVSSAASGAPGQRCCFAGEQSNPSTWSKQTSHFFSVPRMPRWQEVKPGAQGGRSKQPHECLGLETCYDPCWPGSLGAGARASDSRAVCSIRLFQWPLFRWAFEKVTERAPASVAQWIECWTVNQRVTSLVGLQARPPVGGA